MTHSALSSSSHWFFFFPLCHPLQLMNLRFLAPLDSGLCLLAAPPLRPPGLIDWKRSCGTGRGWPRLTLQAQRIRAWLSAWSSDGLHGSSAADRPWWGTCPSNAPGRRRWPELESREGWEEKRRRGWRQGARGERNSYKKCMILCIIIYSVCYSLRG